MPTSSPIPSSAPEDLLFNAQALDRWVNSTGLTFSDRFGVQRLTRAGATAAISALLVGQRLMPEWNGLVIPSAQFRGATDASATLGTLGFVFDADNDAAAAALLVSGAVDENSTINGASPAGAWALVPTPAGCLTVHAGQLGMTSPLSLATSGTIDAASKEFMRWDFSEPVQWVYILEGPPTNYAGTPGTGSARMLSVYGVIEAV